MPKTYLPCLLDMAKLKRNYLSDRTVGVLTLPDGTELETLEPPWRDNKVNVSCIPEGHYKFCRDKHGRFQWWRILDVEGRTAIEFHEGSKPEHTQGCILLSREGLDHMRRFYDEVNLAYVLEIKS